MNFENLLIAVLATPFSGLIVISAIWFLTRFNKTSEATSQNIANHSRDEIVFLFLDSVLLDVSGDTSLVVESESLDALTPETLGVRLETTFPDVSRSLASITEDAPITLTSKNGKDSLTAFVAENRLRVVLCGPMTWAPQAPGAVPINRSGWSVVAPIPIWIEDEDEALLWTNKEYQALAAKLDQPDSARLFPEIKAPNDPEDVGKNRLGVGENEQGEKLFWYDVTSKKTASGILHFAVDASATVAAESAQREFVQTMTKTFAHLSTGLAIFNRKRELHLFNPALFDMTGLSVDFLSRRPSLYAFLDGLRETRMIPEPKNYSSWRQQIIDLETNAQNGTYCELWTLAGNTTYRVTGRPHPDGAVALLFEDISAEVSTTEKFRSELQFGQAILDSVEEAVAVFSATGVLLRSNQAYCDMWSVEPNVTLRETTVQESTELWQKSCQPSPIWSDIRDFSSTFEERAEWDEQVTRLDGLELRCRCLPLASGATLVSFNDGAVPSYDRMQVQEHKTAAARRA